MVTSALEMAPWRTALQLKQGYALCRREEVCGLLGALHRTAGRPCRTGLEGAPSGVGSAAALQRFVEYLGRVLAQVSPRHQPSYGSVSVHRCNSRMNGRANSPPPPVSGTPATADDSLRP